MKAELSEMSDCDPQLPKDSPEIEPDFPPEYCHYKDEGCELADSCLSCPFLQCIYEESGGRQHWLKKLRDREIARLFCNEGKGMKELALMFGLSQRTIQRALRSSLSTLSFRFCLGEGNHNYLEGLCLSSSSSIVKTEKNEGDDTE